MKLEAVQLLVFQPSMCQLSKSHYWQSEPHTIIKCIHVIQSLKTVKRIMNKVYTPKLVCEQERIHDFSDDGLHQQSNNASELSLGTSYLSVSSHSA